MKKNSTFIVIYGPTASGKTDLALKLGEQHSIEIINGDMGQCYTPLTIGTAKPDWRNERIPHHLFDVVDEPVNFSVARWRSACLDAMRDITHRGNIPVIVGGSGFYIKSLFFPPSEPEHISSEVVLEEHARWDDLNVIDPVRAREIDPHDTYRIARALTLFKQTGVLPSTLKPAFDPPGDCLFIHVDRDSNELRSRIDARVLEMFRQSWVEEVRAIIFSKNDMTSWAQFLKQKGLMGYREITEYLEHHENKEAVIRKIQMHSWHYARRQRIFWRSFKKQLVENGVPIIELNLTLSPLDLYIKQLISLVNSNFSVK